MLAITSDYFQSEGDPQPYLKRIAEAGFTHIHWCHHWETDFLYSDYEIEEIRNWFKEYGLQLLNLHGSHGKEKYWLSPHEYQRLAGIELVQNRIRMAARLGGEVIILHIPSTEPNSFRLAWLTQIRRSLDQLRPYAIRHNVRIALENMAGDDFEMLGTLLSEYSPDYLGLCFDSGHANMGVDGFKHLERHKERLIAIHLHDNDGINDQHKIPFSGNIDWANLSRLIATSGYKQMVNLEVVIHESGIKDENEFLRQAFLAGEKLSEMIRANQSKSIGNAP